MLRMRKLEKKLRHRCPEFTAHNALATINCRVAQDCLIVSELILKGCVRRLEVAGVLAEAIDLWKTPVGELGL